MLWEPSKPAPGARRRRGFTLLELIAVVVVLGILSSLAVPVFGAVRQQMRERVTVTEAKALVREARPLAAFHWRDHIETEDFGDNDFDRSTPGVQPASGSSPWAYTSKHAITVYIHDDGTVTAEAPIAEPNALEAPVTTPTPTPTPTPTATPLVVDLPTTSTDGTTTVGAELGTYVDEFNGTTIVRSGTGLTISLNAANWERLSITHAGNKDTVNKTSGPSVVGVVTKVSNTNVTVALASSEAFTLTIKYNGGSSGLTYSITAIA